MGGLVDLVEGVAQTKTEQSTNAIANVVRAFENNSQGRKHVVKLLLKDSPTAHERMSLVKGVVSPQYARRCAKITDFAGTQITTDNCKTGTTWQSIKALEGKFIIQFINSECAAKSGQSARGDGGDTLYTDQSLERLYLKYRFEHSRYCLLEAREDPKYVSGKIPAKVTVHEANCYAALWHSEQPGFDELEYHRMTVKLAWAELREVGSACILAGNSTAEIRKNGHFDPSTWIFKPRAWSTIKVFLRTQFPHADPPPADDPKKKKPKTQNDRKPGVVILSTTDSHFCPVCESGLQNTRQCEHLESQMGSMTVEYSNIESLPELRELKKKVKKYKLHLSQLKTQRDYIEKVRKKVEMDRSLCLMYRDFVSWYDAKNGKVIDLVFVLLRSNSSNQIVKTEIHNIYWGTDAGQTCYFYRDAMLHLCTKSKILFKIKKLYISGDHGPAFTGQETLYFESTLFFITKDVEGRPCGLIVVSHFLTSYHAFNACDGAGSVVKVSRVCVCVCE